MNDNKGRTRLKNTEIDGAVGLEERLNEMVKWMNGTRARIDQLEEKTGTITGLEKRLNETVEGMNGARDRIDQLEEKTGTMAALEKQLDELVKWMNETRDRIDQLEEKTGTIAGLEERLNETVEGLNGARDRIDRLEEKTGSIAGLEKRLNETVEGLNGTRDRIDKLEEKTGTMAGLEKRLDGMVEGMNGTRNRIDKLEEKMSGSLDHLDHLLRRTKHLEGMAGVTTGDDTVKFDSQGILKKILSDFLGEEKASQLIPEETIDDPVTMVRALKTSIGNFSYADQESNPDTVEIMLRYADQVDSSDKTGIILTYSKDLRKILETGQAVLAAIGKQKVKTRSIMEETKNLTRKWKDEIDVRSPEHGIPKVMELLTDLENMFM